MFEKIEHIGIAVKDLAISNLTFQKLLNIHPFKTESVVTEKVETSFFQVGESKIELLGGLDDESPISKFIERRGEGIHHIAFEVKDIVSEMKRLKSEGFEILSDSPKLGADNKLVCFIHPKTANGVLIELCQERK